MTRLRLAAILFVILSVVFAGVGVIGIVSVPSLSQQALQLIPLVAVGGFALAALASYLVARRLVAEPR